jgi:hypothetical protein
MEPSATNQVMYRLVKSRRHQNAVVIAIVATIVTACALPLRKKTWIVNTYSGTLRLMRGYTSRQFFALAPAELTIMFVKESLSHSSHVVEMDW